MQQTTTYKGQKYKKSMRYANFHVIFLLQKKQSP